MLNKIPYNISIQNVEYSNNMEYRSVLRQIFYMSCDLDKLKEENPDYDDETLDEELYDSKHVNRALDFIYEHTKTNPIFTELYEKAAARMISTDLTIGLAVLFSYDHLKLFHECLVAYFSNDPPNIEENDKRIHKLLYSI